MLFYIMEIRTKIEEAVNRYSSRDEGEPSAILLDSETYFELKIEVLGSAEIAIELEVTEHLGIPVFHNNLGYNYIHVV